MFLIYSITLPIKNFELNKPDDRVYGCSDTAIDSLYV